MKALTNFISPSAVPVKPKLASTQDAKCTQRAAMEPYIPASPFREGPSAKPLEKQSTTFILAFFQLFSHICSTLARHVRRLISCRM